MSQTYKKLVSGVPDGGLIAYENLEQILKLDGKFNVNINDVSALVSAGYVFYEFFDAPEVTGSFTKEYVADTDVEISTGKWSNAWKLVDRTMSTAELNQAKDRAYLELRKTRDHLLSQTDFYANSDVTMPDNIKTYRQALRDLPSNTADPFNVTWPTNPIGIVYNN